MFRFMAYVRHRYTSAFAVLEEMRHDACAVFSAIAKKRNYSLSIVDKRGVLFDEQAQGIAGMGESGAIRVDLSTGVVRIEPRFGARSLDARLTKLSIPHTFDASVLDGDRDSAILLNIHLARKHLESALDVDNTSLSHEARLLKHNDRLQKQRTKENSKGRT